MPGKTVIQLSLDSNKKHVVAFIELFSKEQKHRQSTKH